MTPKEKATQLVDKYSFTDDYHTLSKQCALIAVDEIINNVLVGIDLAATWGDYWNKVKQEIEKL